MGKNDKKKRNKILAREKMKNPYPNIKINKDLINPHNVLWYPTDGASNALFMYNYAFDIFSSFQSLCGLSGDPNTTDELGNYNTIITDYKNFYSKASLGEGATATTNNNPMKKEENLISTDSHLVEENKSSELNTEKINSTGAITLAGYISLPGTIPDDGITIDTDLLNNPDIMDSIKYETESDNEVKISKSEVIRSFKDINEKTKKYLKRNIGFIKDVLDEESLKAFEGYIDLIENNNDLFTILVNNPALYNFQQFLGFGPKSVDELNNNISAKSVEELKRVDIYKDIINLKNFFIIKSKTEKLKLKNQKEKWPNHTKKEYINRVISENDKAINSFKKLFEYAEKQNGKTEVDSYLDWPLSTILGFGPNDERSVADSVGYLEGENQALKNGWDPSETCILGVIGGMAKKIDAILVKNRIENLGLLENGRFVRFIADFKTLKDTAWSKEALTLADKRSITKKLVDILNVYYKKNVSNRSEELVNDCLKLGVNSVYLISEKCKEYDRMLERNITITNKIGPKYNEAVELLLSGKKPLGDSEELKSVLMIERVMKHNNWPNNKFTFKLMQDMYKYYNACYKNFGAPQDDLIINDIDPEDDIIFNDNNINLSDSKDSISINTNSKNNINNKNNINIKNNNKNIIKKNNINKNVNNIINNDVTLEDYNAFAKVYKKMLTKQITSKADYFEMLNEISKCKIIDLSKSKKIKNSNSIKSEFKTNLDNVKNTELKTYEEKTMQGLNGDRFDYLKNILHNMKSENSDVKYILGTHKNSLKFDTMVYKIDKLVSMGPENEIAPEYKSGYDLLKEEAIKAICNYMEGKTKKAWNSNGTIRRKQAILAAAMIDPKEGVDLCKKYNNYRITGRLNLEDIKGVEGVGKKYNKPQPIINL